MSRCKLFSNKKSNFLERFSRLREREKKREEKLTKKMDFFPATMMPMMSTVCGMWKRNEEIGSLYQEQLNDIVWFSWFNCECSAETNRVFATVKISFLRLTIAEQHMAGVIFVRCEGKIPAIIKDVHAGCCLRSLEKLIIDSELCSNEARAFCSIFQFNIVSIYFRRILGGISDWLAGCPDGCEICSTSLGGLDGQSKLDMEINLCTRMSNISTRLMVRCWRAARAIHDMQTTLNKINYCKIHSANLHWILNRKVKYNLSSVNFSSLIDTRAGRVCGKIPLEAIIGVEKFI